MVFKSSNWLEEFPTEWLSQILSGEAHGSSAIPGHLREASNRKLRPEAVGEASE